MSELLETVVGSGNLFADMGLEETDELMTRAQLGYAVHKIPEGRKRKQRETAELLGINQAEVSNLVNGKYRCSTKDRRGELANPNN